VKELIFQIYTCVYYVACVSFLLFWFFEHRKRFFYFSMVALLIPLFGLYMAVIIMLFEKRLFREQEEARFDPLEINDVIKSATSEIEFARYRRLLERDTAVQNPLQMMALETSAAVERQTEMLNSLGEAKKVFESDESLRNAAAYILLLREYMECGLFDGKAVESAFSVCDSLLDRLIQEGKVSPAIYEQKIRNLIQKKDYAQAMKLIDALQVLDSDNEHVIFFKMKIYANEDSDRFVAYIDDLYNDPNTMNSNYYSLVMFFAS